MNDDRNPGCGEWGPVLHAFIDGELDLMQAAKFDTHLAGCPDCREEIERVRGVRRLIGRDGVRFPLPDEVRSQVLSALSQEVRMPRSTPRAETQPVSTWGRAFRFIRDWSLVPSLAALAASAVLFLNTPAPDLGIEDQLLASHVHSMLADHLTDVQTSNQHTVKPWFNGRIDFSPPVNDLSKDGFPLVGGRADYIGGRVVAALIYRHNGHVINLFIWPQAAGGQADSEHDGYNMARWSADGLVFWAVSDVSAADLARFRTSFMRPPAN
ncbi:anti-sigma factor (plasmid) [Rhizobium grahamii]|uniref:Anti-sigma factor n=1 Tax=Rhizobium grahamii TaxID=1120045 RepID=A0A5Q0CBP5_9HYPH|nr:MULTISPECIES: anti-sigma factor [Rhizobium]QFY63276.1 anti-sigma factor [Rhizobium grahamii]QRM51960.1 anti-sigma factor [Rhizobium sp. BG6]